LSAVTEPEPSHPTEPALDRPLAGPLLIAAAFFALAAWSWGKWPDPVVDFGRELYAPWRLVLGERLYADVAWFNGPLSVWWNALLFRLFGVGLATLVWANLALLALATALLYRLLAGVGGRIAATAACLVFLGVFAFGQQGGIGNYNFVTPYSHELTHGFVLALAGITALERACRRRGGLAAILAGLLLGLVFLTKFEVFLALAAAFAARLLALLGRPDTPGSLRRVALPVLFGALVAPACAWLWLARELGAAHAGVAVLGALPYLASEEVRALPFYASGMGLDDPARSVDLLLKWTAGYACLFGLPALIAWFLRGHGERRGGALLTALPFAVYALVLWANRGELDWNGIGRPLPLVAAAIAIGASVALVRARRAGAQRDAAALTLALAVFALVLCAKLLLNARVVHYGFVLTLPATALLVVLVVGWLPDWLTKRGRAGGFARSAALGVLLAVVIVHLGTAREWYAWKVNVVGSGRDAFYAASRGEYLWRVAREVEARLPADGRLLVLPEGVMLNYLTRRRSPTRYVNFMPPELIFFGEEEILAALAADPPELVALVHKDTTEYGYRFFGTDYGRGIGGWVRANYREVLRVGEAPLRDGRFGIALLERIPR